MGNLIAFCAALMPNRVSRQARQNIELCLGDLDPAAKRHLHRESLRHTCYAVTELAAVWCWPVEQVLELITSTDICAEFDQSSRGRIILVPHLGSWETFAVWLGREHAGMFLYKRRKNPAVDEFVRLARARSGGTPVPTKKHGLRKLLVGLKSGGSLMILPDQKPGRTKAHIKSTFFGFSAPTTTLVQNLCTKVDCDVFIATMCRRDPVGEFSLSIQPLEHARLAADEIDSAQYMNDRIEALARENLAQYQWGYRRFDSSAYATLAKEN